MKKETEFSRYVMRKLRAAGVFPVRIETRTAVGIPDIYCVYKGMSFWIETKVGGGRLEPGQHAFSMTHARAGGFHTIVLMLDGGEMLWAPLRGTDVFITLGALEWLPCHLETLEDTKEMLRIWLLTGGNDEH